MPVAYPGSGNRVGYGDPHYKPAGGTMLFPMNSRISG